MPLPTVTMLWPFEQLRVIPSVLKKLTPAKVGSRVTEVGVT